MDEDFVLKNSLRNEQIRKLAIEFHRKTVANPLRKDRHDRDMLHVGEQTLAPQAHRGGEMVSTIQTRKSKKD